MRLPAFRAPIQVLTNPYLLITAVLVSAELLEWRCTMWTCFVHGWLLSQMTHLQSCQIITLSRLLQLIQADAGALPLFFARICSA